MGNLILKFIFEIFTSINFFHLHVFGNGGTVTTVIHL